MGRDFREEVEFDEAGELARGDFVLLAERVEEGHVEELGGRDADADFPGREFGVDVGLQGDEGEGAVFEEVGVVAVVAEVVEGFVGIFDGDFGAGGGGAEGFDHCVVEVGAVSVRVVRGEDEELRYSGAGGERCGRDWFGRWEDEIPHCGFARGGGDVGDETIGSRVSDD